MRKGLASAKPNSQQGSSNSPRSLYFSVPGALPARLCPSPLPIGPGNWALNANWLSSGLAPTSNGMEISMVALETGHTQAIRYKSLSTQALPAFQRNYCAAPGAQPFPTSPQLLSRFQPCQNPGLDPKGPARGGFQRSLKKPKPLGCAKCTEGWGWGRNTVSRKAAFNTCLSDLDRRGLPPPSLPSEPVRSHGACFLVCRASNS